MTMESPICRLKETGWQSKISKGAKQRDFKKKLMNAKKTAAEGEQRPVTSHGGAPEAGRTGRSQVELQTENEVLRQQLVVFQEDFDRERHDRAKAQSLKDDYKKQNEQYKKKVSQLELENGKLDGILESKYDSIKQLREGTSSLKVKLQMVEKKNKAYIPSQVAYQPVVQSLGMQPQRQFIYGQQVQPRPKQYVLQPTYEQQLPQLNVQNSFVYERKNEEYKEHLEKGIIFGGEKQRPVTSHGGVPEAGRTGRSQMELQIENEFLRQQLLVLQEDFDRERHDRAKAQSLKDDYKKQNEHYKKRVRHLVQKNHMLDGKLRVADNSIKQLQEENSTLEIQLQREQEKLLAYLRSQVAYQPVVQSSEMQPKRQSGQQVQPCPQQYVLQQTYDLSLLNGETATSLQRDHKNNKWGNFIDTTGYQVSGLMWESHGKAVQSVCMIVYPGGTGTGFRVGNEKKCIMTAAHVYEHISQSAGRDGIGRKHNNLLKRPDVFAVFGYLKEGEFKDENKFNFKEILHFRNNETDTVIMELEDHPKGAPMPPPLQYFHTPDFTKEFFFVGHSEGKPLRVNKVDKIVNIESSEAQTDISNVKKLSVFHTKCLEFPEGREYEVKPHQTLDNPHRFLFHCRFTKGASGSPGLVFLNDGRIVVVSMLLRGYPDWYYDPNPNMDNFRSTWSKDSWCVEQGVNLLSVYKSLTKKDPRLAKEIFYI